MGNSHGWRLLLDYNWYNRWTELARPVKFCNMFLKRIMYKVMENEILTKFIRIVINKKQLVVSRRLLGSLTGGLSEPWTRRRYELCASRSALTLVHTLSGFFSQTLFPWQLLLCQSSALLYTGAVSTEFSALLRAGRHYVSVLNLPKFNFNKLWFI